MPQINLLTTTGSKKKKVKSLEIPKVELAKVNSVFLPISFVVIGVLIAVWLILSFIVVKNNKELALLDKKKSSLSASPKEIGEISLKKELLAKKLDILDGLSSRNFFWAEKLEKISGFVPEGVWLTEISLDKINLGDGKKEKETQLDKFALKLKGSAFAYKIQDAVDLIGKFNNLLKDDESFFKDFSEINLKVAKSAIAKTDIMNFDFNLSLK